MICEFRTVVGQDFGRFWISQKPMILEGTDNVSAFLPFFANLVRNADYFSKVRNWVDAGKSAKVDSFGLFLAIFERPRTDAIKVYFVPW